MTQKCKEALAKVVSHMLKMTSTREQSNYCLQDTMYLCIYALIIYLLDSMEDNMNAHE